MSKVPKIVNCFKDDSIPNHVRVVFSMAWNNMTSDNGIDDIEKGFIVSYV